MKDSVSPRKSLVFASSPASNSSTSSDYMLNLSELPSLGHWDTVVVGGGTAGASCAISAAREGNSTLILETFSSLGGSCVHALVGPMMNSSISHQKNLVDLESYMRSQGVETRESPQRMDYIWFSADHLQDAFEHLADAAGVDVLFNTSCVYCMVSDNKIHAVVVSTVEGLRLVWGDQFVDASGDATLSRLAGVPCVSGDDEGNNQVSSLRFEMANIDVEAYRTYCLSLHDTFSPLKDGYFWESAMVKGRGFALEPLFQKAVDDCVLIPEDLVYYQCFSVPGEPGVMAFNCPHLPAIRKNTSVRARSQALREGRQKIRRLARFLKEYMPGFEHSFVVREADMLGVRESWRIQGVYTLEVEDYIKRARFEDCCARATWYIDVHSATKGLVHMEKYRKGEYFEIPYRALINDRIVNMLTVGRCISASFLVQASIRIIQTVIDMGDSAGRACARAHQEGIELRDFAGGALMDNHSD